MCFTGRNVTVNGPIFVGASNGAVLNRATSVPTSFSRQSWQAENVVATCASSSARVPVNDRRLCANIFAAHSQSDRQWTLRVRRPFAFTDHCQLRRTDSS